MQLVPFLETQFSYFLCAYRESYNTQHVLIRLSEEWRENLDSNILVEGVFVDTSKAFDFTPHNLLIAKFAAYGFKETALKYLKNRIQCVRLNNTHSDFKDIFRGFIKVQ